jgi:DNA polymerase-1
MLITLDFETEAIVGNPMVRPPKPVGLAVLRTNRECDGLYLTDWELMKTAWREVLASNEPLLFQNAPFDLSVGLHWLGGEEPKWERVHDTMFILFQTNPYSHSLSLKPSADHYLDLPPQEEEHLHNWILQHVPEATKSTAGAYISLAPVQLVSPYAIGDVFRTRLLFDRLIDGINISAYEREQRLSPKLRESSIKGIRLDQARLQKDYDACLKSMSTCDDRIYERLGCEEFNIGSGIQLADRLDRAGLVDDWILTPKGRRSTAKDNLIKVCKDAELVALLAYRSTMKTCTGTFMSPWLEFSQEDGRVHTEWNQVANDEGVHAGARTGRLSSSRPNFQNPPNPFGMAIPTGLSPLPNMRSYLLPEKNHVWIKRDFSSQELRILAHFEDGALMEAYNADAFLDPHEMARELIHQHTGVWYPREDVKQTGFGIIYGMGVPGLAQQLGRPRGEAYTLREAYFGAMPAAAMLASSTRARGRSGGVITTWGGREYATEPPKVIHGQMRTFEYKLLNYLIQGSAGDQTKQVLCDWWEDFRDPDDVFMTTIHDEINVSVPEEHWHKDMSALRIAMDQDLFDVPMRSEGFHGAHWGSLTKMTKEEDYGL